MLARKVNVETVPVYFQKTQLLGQLNRGAFRIFVVPVERAGTGSRWPARRGLRELGEERGS